jgi:hypothetical protein
MFIYLCYGIDHDLIIMYLSNMLLEADTGFGEVCYQVITCQINSDANYLLVTSKQNQLVPHR